ncbi:MAG: hypothetical protein JSV86_04815 [Gemmatimonadota bacterium]|nr:MAG: hypothetical protein JSV86_04815 [Gemmatimonadota bacterium]
MKRAILLLAASVVGLGLMLPTAASAQEELPVYLRDRGTGVSSSMFGTYIRRGELIVYPFYEYYRDSDMEYEPAEFGFELAQEFRGKYRAHEFLLFLGLGITDGLILELEAAVIDATLTKAEDDPSDMPNELSESGLGDVESQLRWRWFRETERRPELFSYFETVFPTGESQSLIGTSDWEFKLGVGAIRGFAWGTLTLRTAMEFDAEENKLEFGEYALEYLKRVSDFLRVVTLVEGEQDEVELILESQLHFSPRVFAKLNVGIGVTSKATDLAPELGVMFSFPIY